MGHAIGRTGKVPRRPARQENVLGKIFPGKVLPFAFHSYSYTVNQ
jgi:hypothetical protein